MKRDKERDRDEIMGGLFQRVVGEVEGRVEREKKKGGSER